MRFLPDGPNIPDELLEARDQGDVIFLCGAGVSRPAGLPGFMQLARDVIKKLGTPIDAPSRALLDRVETGSTTDAPLDQVFQNLKYEYGDDYIDQVVNDLLRPAPDPNVEQHRTILRLSRSAAHRPQIVTTNFDLLFERADPSLQATIAPTLPELTAGQPLEGIVYLHGRCREGADRAVRHRSQLILGSADFGRAYLAEGWATKFVADLLRYYTIVLVGYSATDPPVRYLLQGIHARGEERPTRIYAFDRGTQNAIHARWRDRGVTVLAYPDADSEHVTLWKTLRTWAERADDVDRWRQSIVRLASRRPSELEPFERGQVCSLARTEAGAKLFRESPTPPPAEWLCVFDRSVRYGEPVKLSEDGEVYDSLTHFGLDDDPPRTSDIKRENPIAAADVISALAHEEIPGKSRLAGMRKYQSAPITSRLFHLAHWMIRLLDDPVFAWWASGYEALHPRLVALIEWKFEKGEGEIPPLAYQLWRILLEKSRQFPRDDFGAPWYPFVRQQKRDGWTASVLRDFERIMRPYFISKRPGYGRAAPPRRCWAELKMHDLADLDVVFLERDPADLSIPTGILPSIFRILRYGLEQSAGMLAEIDTGYWRTATFIPENEPGHLHHDAFDAHLLWTVRMFDRLAEEHPEIARTEIRLWPIDERFIFDKLRLYAWRDKKLISGVEVGNGILCLSAESFWNFYHRRELLHALQNRWGDIEVACREKIENRIVDGRERLPDEDEAEYRRHVSVTAAQLLGWLQLHKCELSMRARSILPELRRADSRWQPAWDEHVDGSGDTRAYSVDVDANPSKIQDAPISELIKRATEYARRDFELHIHYDPFRGVVVRRPRRAFLALAYEARKQCYPQELWKTLLQNWPDNSSSRLCWALASHLVRLPSSVVFELRHSASSWLNKQFPALVQVAQDRALGLWDALLEKILEGEKSREPVPETTSALGSHRRSNRTHERAINSSVGHLTEALLTMLSELRLKAGEGIPGTVRLRLERLLSLAGTTRDYSLSTMGASLVWLHWLDPEWARLNLLPYFDLQNTDAEPAWNGFIYDQHQVSPELFALLKTQYLGLFTWVQRQAWDDTGLRHFTELLVIYALWHQNGGRYVSYSEVRIALQQSSPEGRAHALWRLSRLVKELRNWNTFGKPFIENAWPRELRLQSAATSNNLADLAALADEEFPVAVETILPLLVPVDHMHLLFNETSSSEANGGGAQKLHRRFPEAFLALLDRLVPPEGGPGMHGLAEVVTGLAEAAPSLRQDLRWRRLNEITVRA